MSIESVMPSNHPILCCPLLLLPSVFASIRVFSKNRLFASGGQSIGTSASASVLPMNIQGWYPLGLTGLISLLSKGLSRVFTSTTFQKHQFFNTQFSSVQLLSRVQLFATPWTVACQASLSITNSRSLLKCMSIESVMPSNHLILYCPLLLWPQSFPASGSFLMSQVFSSGSQSIGASASVLPMNIQYWFPLGWASWIFLQSKGLSRVFSNTTVLKHQFFGPQLSLWSNSHIHTWLLEKP